jgi:hypothetical protein
MWCPDPRLLPAAGLRSAAVTVESGKKVGEPRHAHQETKL